LKENVGNDHQTSDSQSMNESSSSSDSSLSEESWPWYSQGKINMKDTVSPLISTAIYFSFQFKLNCLLCFLYMYISLQHTTR